MKVYHFIESPTGSPSSATLLPVQSRSTQRSLVIVWTHGSCVESALAEVARSSIFSAPTSHRKTADNSSKRRRIMRHCKDGAPSISLTLLSGSDLDFPCRHIPAIRRSTLMYTEFSFEYMTTVHFAHVCVLYNSLENTSDVANMSLTWRAIEAGPNTLVARGRV